MKKKKRHIKEIFQIKRRIKQLKKELNTLPDQVMSMVRELPTEAEKIYEE